MEKKIYSAGTTKINYYVQGKSPELLLVSGIHGDEYGVIDSAIMVLSKLQSEMPEFLYIPEISPTAVKAKTRCNCNGVDINRSFKDGATEVEAKIVMDFLKDRKFNTFISFHEDPEHSGFYFYDSGNMENDECLPRLRNNVKNLGVELLNGVDDPHDEHLGVEFVDGYKANRTSGDGGPNCAFGPWLVSRGIVDRIYCMEVPGMLDPDLKDKLVEKILYNLVIC
jgi:hypothetical protein